MRILLLIALPTEVQGFDFSYQTDEDTVEVAFTGVGKLNAAATASTYLAASYYSMEDYDCVINAGTCGSHKHPVGTVLHPTKLVQGDCYLTSNFDFKPIASLSFPIKGKPQDCTSILTQDTFTTFTDGVPPLFQQFDCFDMESYAIGKFVTIFHIRDFKLIKIVSDNLDKPLTDWEGTLAPLREPLAKAIESLIKTYIPSYEIKRIH